MGSELLRIIDSIHRDKNIDSEVVFTGIESAILLAAKKHFGEEADVTVHIDRNGGGIRASHEGQPIDAETLGRISAQLAKQVIIQKIREAERDATFDEFVRERGSIVVGTVQRYDGGVVLVTVGKSEAILPRSEQMPGETFRPQERVKAMVLDVRKVGQRVKIILSRVHPDFVKRLFEQEIPEIAEHIIEIKAIAREAGYRSKVAVSSIDSKVDCVGACVGVRGNRIKSVLDELGGERIDIIRYNESLQVLIPAALQPAQIEEVQFYSRIGRAIVLVQEDQLSLAIGKKGQNVRLASKLCGIDIEIMTFDELSQQIKRAETDFARLPAAEEGIVDQLIEEGILSFVDLSLTEIEDVMEMTGLDEATAVAIVKAAEREAEAAPQDQGSRSSMLAGQPTTPAVSHSESSSRSRGLTAEDLFGPDQEPEPVEEDPMTAAQLFGPDPAPSSEGTEAEEDSNASEELAPKALDGNTGEEDEAEEVTEMAAGSDEEADQENEKG